MASSLPRTWLPSAEARSSQLFFAKRCRPSTPATYAAEGRKSSRGSPSRLRCVEATMPPMALAPPRKSWMARATM
jgi:hypothetical protein